MVNAKISYIFMSFSRKINLTNGSKITSSTEKVNLLSTYITYLIIMNLNNWSTITSYEWSVESGEHSWLFGHLSRVYISHPDSVTSKNIGDILEEICKYTFHKDYCEFWGKRFENTQSQNSQRLLCGCVFLNLLPQNSQ